MEPEGVSELLGDSVCERTLSEGSENIAVSKQSIAEKLSQNCCALYDIVSKCPKDVFIRKLIDVSGDNLLDLDKLRSELYQLAAKKARLSSRISDKEN